MDEYELAPTGGLVLCILTIYAGTWLTNRFRVLKENYIPPAVTGGLLFSLLLGVIYWANGLKVTLDLGVRDHMLLVFFSTIGLSAKLRVLSQGGKALALLVGIAAVFLVLQDVIGCLIMWLLGQHPAYGLFGGSISFAGGHGTAIAWGETAEAAGLEGAAILGVGCATFGLIVGGMIGGPIARRLIERHGIQPPADQRAPEVGSAPAPGHAFDSRDVLNTLLALAICVGVGEAINLALFSRGVMLPGFLTAMLTGIVLTNLVDVFQGSFNQPAIDLTQEVSLQIFLTLSMMSMELWSLAEALGLVLIVIVAQATLMTVYSQFVVFRLMGRDYDAVVISAGFAGLGMGATPVAIANMDSVTRKFGPSTKAFLVVPLVGAFFIDVLNALVIKFFAGLPFLQAAAN